MNFSSAFSGIGLVLLAHAAPIAFGLLLTLLAGAFAYIGSLLMKLQASKERHAALAVAAAAEIGYHKVRDLLTRDLAGKNTLTKADLSILGTDAVKAGLAWLGSDAVNDVKVAYGHTDDELAALLQGKAVNLAVPNTLVLTSGADGVPKAVVVPRTEIGKADVAIAMAIMLFGFAILACSKTQEQAAAAEVKADVQAVVSCALPDALPFVLNALEGHTPDYAADLVTLEKQCGPTVVKAIVANAATSYQASVDAGNPPSPTQHLALVRANAYLGHLP